MPKNSKSPFVVNRNVLSNKICEELTGITFNPDDELFIETVDNSDISDIISTFITPNIESRFSVTIAESNISIESRGVRAQPVHSCESCVHSGGKWFRNKDIDFITVIFLKDHLASPDEPIDVSFEVYGGKLEFPTFNFGFLPERGTAVTYPAVPNFLNTIANIKIGQLDILRIAHRSDTMFIYEPEKYPGNPGTWFADLH